MFSLAPRTTRTRDSGRLVTASVITEACSVDSRTRSGAIYDLYVGPEQSVPIPFEDFWLELDLNPYIAAHERRNRQPAA